MIRIIILLAFFVSQNVYSETALSSNWGIFPDKSGNYLLSNSSFMALYDNEKKFNYSMNAYTYSKNASRWLPSRKFAMVLKSKDGQEVRIDENGFSSNKKVLCKYRSEFRRVDAILDSRVFERNCARKYGLISYKDKLASVIGLKVSEDKAPFYLLNGVRYYPKSLGDGYALKKSNRKFASKRPEDITEVQEFLNCLKIDSCMFFTPHKKFNMISFFSPFGFLSPAVANNNYGLSPNIQNAFEDCGLLLPERELSDLVRYKYETHLIRKCLVKLLLDNSKIAIYEKNDYKLVLTGEDLGIELRYVFDGSNKKLRLALITFRTNFFWSDTSQLYRPTNLCRTERHKEECKFWEEYFQKYGWDAPYRKTNFPVVPNSEIEKLVKDKYEYTGKQ